MILCIENIDKAEAKAYNTQFIFNVFSEECFVQKFWMLIFFNEIMLMAKVVSAYGQMVPYKHGM